MTSPAPASNSLVDACKTLMKELERNGTTAPEELVQAQDLLETIDQNAERIAAVLAESRRRRKTGDEGLGAIAGLLREQDQFFQQIMNLYEKLSQRPLFPANEASAP